MGSGSLSTILLVEDSPSDRAVIRTILMRGGFTVHEVAYGREAAPLARDLRPLAVVLDLNLPDIDGHTVCRELKADALLASTPVLMLTVRDDERDVLAGLQAGADDYVAKDSPPEIVLARVRRLVHDRQMTLLAALNQQLAQVGRLLAGIVHEIRGPLSVIRGNAEVMRMTIGEDHDAQRYVEPIIRNAQILQVRLEHLMATVRGGASQRRPTEIVPVVREAADLFLKSTDPRRDKLSVRTDFAEDLPVVQADSGRLMQVMMNLLGNSQEALRAAQADGCIEVAARLAEQPDQTWIQVEVRDDGPGIPEPLLGRIFEPFFTTKAEGSGYGLYLASEILKEHGGRLTAANRSPRGACFTLWLPVEPAEGSRPATSNGEKGR